MSVHEIKIPSPGESITEVEIGNWLKKDGDLVQIDESLCEIETDKATLPLVAEVAGKLKIFLEQGATANVGDVACSIDPDKAGSIPVEEIGTTTLGSDQPGDPVEEKKSSSQETVYAKGHPSPAAQKIMNQEGMKAGQIEGTGPGGRILKQDVSDAMSEPTNDVKLTEKPVSNHEVRVDVKNSTPIPSSSSPVSVPSGQREVKRQRMSRLRRKLSERLVSVKNETAMLTTFNEIDMQSIYDLRSKYKDGFEKKHDVRLGFMGFFIKACSEALREFPAVNSQIDGEEIVSFEYVDMGIAVSAPKGLMVPVIRNAETLSIAEIETEIRRLAARARENQLSLAEMEGGTFSITNGGVFGSMLSTPILNPPQAAILGMHNIVERPMAINGEVKIRPVMFIALSYDHRLIDGQQSVSFLVRLKELLETPARMILGV
ncbi:MAG TPA: 2-oxoglutarate dehydrogenase complex dihydrolipoyllysine-residue succinyltransferase [SAR324 cluster bacterium]|nr:2-oxoglutarate dehydrogenase complex dihydrolipoyllysine-residue succinyltransferase [SAR324 cluster bacterium]|tara:strand:+ start:864 stop:2156 length:1293 start_codon:yes stop_codon:yes gene_type:complete